jgi:hypothetical protein
MDREQREWGRDIWALTAPDSPERPPSLNTQGLKTRPMWLHDFLMDPGKTKIRPAVLQTRMPTFHFSEAELSVLTQYLSAVDKAPYPFISTEVETTPELLKAGELLFNKFSCVNCHAVGATPKKQESAVAAPNFALSTERLRPEWLPLWLLDPQRIAPGTSMPTYWPDGQSQEPTILNGDGELQRKAIRDYLFLGLPGAKRGGK